MNQPELFEYTGAVHIHSAYSDGSGTVGDIIRAARESGLDYIILTDHNTLRARKEGYEKFYGNLLLITGYEINDKENRNHYLALRVDETFSTRLPAEKYVRLIHEAGGFGFIAHPHEKRNSMEEHPPYPWTAWDCAEIRGIEIWNHMSEWMENLTEQNRYESFLHPLRTISAPPAETLSVWDKLNESRKVVGIGGVDAHAHKVNVLGFFEVEVFPYKVLFKSIRTHILLSLKINFNNSGRNIQKATGAMLDALEYGSCFTANDNIADSRGFRFFAAQNGQYAGMGDTLTLTGPFTFHVTVPVQGATVKLIRNGVTCSVSEDTNPVFDCTEAGVYRTEVYYKQKAWIFSNHIRVC